MSRRKEKEKEKGKEGRLHLAGSLFSSSIDFKAGVFLPSAHRSHAKTSSFGVNAVPFDWTEYHTEGDSLDRSKRETFVMDITYTKLPEEKETLHIVISGIGNKVALHGVKDSVVEKLKGVVGTGIIIKEEHTFVCSNAMQSTCIITAHFPFAAQKSFSIEDLGPTFIPKLLGCDDVRDQFTMDVFGSDVKLGYKWIEKWRSMDEKLDGTAYVWKSTDLSSELPTVPSNTFFHV